VSGLSRAATLVVLAAVLCLAQMRPASAATGRGAEFQLGPGMHADALTVGPDGNIWFAGTKYGPGSAVDVVGRSTLDGQITEFALPARGEAELGISSITTAPGGYLYFTEPNANRLGRINTSGEISEEILPNPGSKPRTIVAGPDGTLWFTEEGGDRLGHFIPNFGLLRERQLGPGARPTGIAARADGTIWIAEPGLDGYAFATTAGGSEFGIPFPNPAPSAVVPGPEGHVWFTEESGPWLGQVTSAAQTASQYQRLGVQTVQGTRLLAFGPGGDFWYTTGNRIGSISPDLWLADAACLPAGCDLSVTALTAGPEGSLWYASGVKQGGDRFAQGTIGRFLPPRINATVSRSTGRFAGRRVKLAISCNGGAAGEFCRGHLRVLGRLGGGSKPVLVGSRGLVFRVHSNRSMGVLLSPPAAALLRREGRLPVRVAISVSGGHSTSSHLVLRASG
jgi:virginiamycin B lyase